jgi:hypothetical protein
MFNINDPDVTDHHSNGGLPFGGLISWTVSHEHSKRKWNLSLEQENTPRFDGIVTSVADISIHHEMIICILYSHFECTVKPLHH